MKVTTSLASVLSFHQQQRAGSDELSDRWLGGGHGGHGGGSGGHDIHVIPLTPHGLYMEGGVG